MVYCSYMVSGSALFATAAVAAARLCSLQQYYSPHAERGVACCKRALFALHALRVFLPARPRTNSSSADFCKQTLAVLHCKPARDATISVLTREVPSEQFACATTKVWFEAIQFPLRYSLLSQLSRSAQQALHALGLTEQTQTSGATERCNTTSLITGVWREKLPGTATEVVLLQQCRSWLAWALEPTELQTPLQLYTALQLPGLHAQLALQHCMQSTIILATGT
eukprot:3955-Heterococcus_DN1.PRE.2